MKRVIAVEDGLSTVASLLQSEGYKVVGMHAEELERASAVVVTGGDSNILGIQNIDTYAPVISAEGKSPEEVLDDVEDALLFEE